MRQITRMAASIATLAIMGCSKSAFPPASGTCENRNLHELYSPDREWKVVRYERWCAGGDIALQLSVLPASEQLPNVPGNALRQNPAYDRIKYDHRPPETMELVWNGPRELRVMCNAEMKLECSVSQVGNVAVVISRRSSKACGVCLYFARTAPVLSLPHDDLSDWTRRFSRPSFGPVTSIWA